MDHGAELRVLALRQPPLQPGSAAPTESAELRAAAVLLPGLLGRLHRPLDVDSPATKRLPGTSCSEVQPGSTASPPASARLSGVGQSGRALHRALARRGQLGGCACGAPCGQPGRAAALRLDGRWTTGLRPPCGPLRGLTTARPPACPHCRYDLTTPVQGQPSRSALRSAPSAGGSTWGPPRLRALAAWRRLLGACRQSTSTRSTRARGQSSIAPTGNGAAARAGI